MGAFLGKTGRPENPDGRFEIVLQQRLFLLQPVEGKIWYLISVLAGGFVTAVMVNLLKKDYVDVTVEKEDTVNLDEITFDEF